jgi:hypothetical protein
MITPLSYMITIVKRNYCYNSSFWVLSPYTVGFGVKMRCSLRSRFCLLSCLRRGYLIKGDATLGRLGRSPRGLKYLFGMSVSKNNQPTSTGLETPLTAICDFWIFGLLVGGVFLRIRIGDCYAPPISNRREIPPY